MPYLVRFGTFPHLKVHLPKINTYLNLHRKRDSHAKFPSYSTLYIIQEKYCAILYILVLFVAWKHAILKVSRPQDWISKHDAKFYPPH